MTDGTRPTPPLLGDDDVPAWAETGAGYGGRVPRARTNEQAARLREAADLLDSLPGLPNLYIVCSSADGRVAFQVPSSLSDAVRVAAVDQLAAATGVTVEAEYRRLDRTWYYGTDYRGGAPFEIYTAGLSADPTQPGGDDAMRDVWASEQQAAADEMTPLEEYEYWHGGDDQ